MATEQLTHLDQLRTGVACLCIIAKSHEIHVHPDQIMHALGSPGDDVASTAILEAANFLGLTARRHKLKWHKLSHISWPAIAHLNNGQYLVIVRADPLNIRFFDPLRPGSPLVCSKAEFEAIWDGRMLLTKPAEAQATAFGFKWFLPEVIKHRSVLIEIFLAAFMVQLFGLAGPLFSQVIIDKVVVHRNLSTLHVLGMGMVLLMLFEAMLTLLQAYLTTHTASRIDVVLGARVVRHLLRLPLRYFETRRIGTIVAQVRELETVRQFITGASVGSVLDCLSIVILVPLMFYYSTTLAWVVLASLPFFIASSLVLIPMMRRRLDMKFQCAAENQSFLVESVSGIQTIKSLAVEPVMERRWEKTLSRYIAASYRASLLGGMGGTLGQVIQKGITLAILWLGAEAVLRGEMSVGQLIAFQMLSGRVVQPIVRIAQLWQEFQQMAMSVARLGDIMNTHTEPRHSRGRSKQRIHGEVVLDDVCFAYQPDGPLILNHLSLRVPAGQTIGIVGRSGSGKSTLSRLLQRLYQPGAGKISIDGVDIRLIDPAHLRSQIGVVLQENFLFDGSISENIAIHFPSASMDRVIAAARTAGAHDFIMALGEGYDTRVGERGLSLSGGQRQRIAIARALIGDPRILVFDEATSALDYESERIIQDNLREICQGRTVFIIAHRLSTVQGADSIIVLDQGSIAEQGPHQRLIASGGLYTHLFSQQAGAPA